MKNLGYLFIALLLGAGIWWAISSQTNSTIKDIDAADFAVTDTAAIHKILIKDRVKSAVLERQSDGSWRVNGGYKARAKSLDQLLTTLRRLKVKTPVAAAARASVNELFESPQRKVYLFKEDQEEPFKSILIAGASQQQKSTYMMLEGTGMPYEMSIFGFEGDLTAHFFTKEKNWRDRTLFNFKADQIAEVKMDYKTSPEASFIYTKADENVVRVNDAGQATKGNLKLNKPALFEYKQAFKEVNFEAYENEHPKIDSIRASAPFALMEVTLENGKKRSVRLHFMKASKRSKSIKENKQGVWDGDRFFAFLDGKKDLVMIQRYVFEPFLLGYEDLMYEALREG